MTNISRRSRASAKLKSMGDHNEFLNRITKSLYYARLPMTDCLSLPVTELAAELFTEVKGGHSLERLYTEEASKISRNACVSPCSLVLALLYLERLRDCNTEYLKRVAPSELFLISLMVASKFLHDDGEEDEVFNTEWAQSADMTLEKINELEKDFLKAIDWTVYVRNQDFWERLEKLEQDIAYKEAQKRGWFSYTELSCLMNSVHLVAIASAVINVSSVCLATYAAGVATLVGSAMVASHLPGTLLKPSSSLTHSNDVTKVQMNPLIEAQSPKMDHNTSSENFETDLENWSLELKCNQTCDVDKNVENKEENFNWQWWQSSIMTWLFEYSSADSEEHFFPSKTKFKYSNNKFLFNTDTFLQTNSKLQYSQKKLFGMNLKSPMQDWNYYLTYIIKISLGHWH